MNLEQLHSLSLELAKTKPAGVYPISVDNQKYWVKVCGEDKKTLTRMLSAYLSQFNMMRFLRTNATKSAQQRFEEEVSIMSRLAEQGVPVPALVAKTAQYYVTLDSGRTLNSVEPEQLPLDLSDKVFELFASLHQIEIVHGRPAMRDILLQSDGSVALIDFEESMPAPSPQMMARDMFLLLMDFCRLPQVTEEDKLRGLALWHQRVGDSAWQELKRIARLLNRFRFVAKAILLFKDNRTSKQILNALALIERI
ncbi:RIO1 family regulatory kinase/ATPase [Thaumasiovibrio sp. DFM-14]|uniref:RIO1 family regulatory kinase/ATPase domain-containing protein n=1 Tax=Thaumasiovibrio sp. DFM-14 TaxID=3384792 RepID=UPI0039A16469